MNVINHLHFARKERVFMENGGVDSFFELWVGLPSQQHDLWCQKIWPTTLITKMVSKDVYRIEQSIKLH